MNFSNAVGLTSFRFLPFCLSCPLFLLPFFASLQFSFASSSSQALPTSNLPSNGAVSLANRAASVSHNSILLVEDYHQAPFVGTSSANLSTTNTTLAHSEKSVYKTVTKETQLDEDLSRVAKWATNFDNLLSDKHGVSTFTVSFCNTVGDLEINITDYLLDINE